MFLPEESTIILEGNISAEKRNSFYLSKNVFFCTPQTLLNDIRSGRVRAEEVVCIVVDEAHRATNNYAYTQIIQELSSASNSNTFRVLALTATPGSDMRKIQTVCIVYIQCI
jgi:ERCC4-related helicase